MSKIGFKQFPPFLGWLAITLLFAQFSYAQPSFTSAPVTNSTYNASYNYLITTSGVDPRTISLTSGVLPNGLILTDNGNGTANLSGTILQTGTFPSIQLTVTETSSTLAADQIFTITVTKAIATISLGNLNPTYDGASHAATATTVPPGLSVDITYDGSNTAPTNAGSYSVVATVNDANYQGTTSGTLVIGKAPLTAKADDKTRQYGVANPVFTITYTGFLNSDNASSITQPIASTTATVLSNVGTYSITVSGGTASNYSFAFQSGTLSITKVTPTINWSNPSTIIYGTPLSSTQLNATSSIPGIFSYAPGTGTVLSVGVNQALSVNFTPTDITNYNVVNGTQVLITVNMATPVITWPTPTAITYGAALSVTQLNATSSVAGTFTYTPANGIILNAGIGQTLSVNFAPTDAGNYNNVNNTQVLITVNKATPTVTWAVPSPIIYGTALSGTQLNATANVAGSFIYTPTSGTLLNAGASQTLSTDFTPTDVANYNSVFNTTVQITVNKATPIITWPTPLPIVYGTPLSATQLNASASVPGVLTYTPGSGSIINAGVGQVLSLNFSPTDAVNYSTVSGLQRLITVNKAIPIVTWAPPLPIKVGVALSATQLNATANVPGTFTYSPIAGTSFGVAGSYPLSVDFSPTDLTNYFQVNNTQVTLTVNAKDNPVITWANPSAIIYGTSLSSTQLNATANVPGTFVYTPAAGSVLNSGGSQILSTTFTPSDGVSYNTVSVNVQITVNKAGLTATASNASRVYGQSNPGFTINYSGFVNGDTQAVIDTKPTATCSAVASSVAGSAFPIIPAGGVDNNYTFTYVNGSLSITKAILIAKPDDKSRSYGLPNPTFTISYTGFVNGDNASSITQPTASTTALPTTSVGSYSITLSGGSSSNYSFTLQNGSLVINPSPLFAKADDKTKIYGQANPTLTITYAGFLNGDNSASITAPTITTTATSSAGVGVVPINLSGGTATNYSLILQSGTLTIDKAILTVKPDDKSRQYGVANPVFTITYTGFLNSDNTSSITVPIASTTATNITGAGGYQITLSGGTATNYTLTLQVGTLTITKAPLTAKADDKSRQYGIANPTFTITYTGFLNGDLSTSITVPTASTTATPATNVGTYSNSIVVSGGLASNYNFSYVSGTLTITKAPLTAKADDQLRQYGVANPSFTITYTGFLNSDNASSITAPTASTTATIGNSVGGYQIILSGGTATNYTLTLQDGTLTITKAPLTAKADDKTRQYGVANSAFTITYTGFLNSDNASSITAPTASTAATIGTGVGGYAITLLGGTATNYTLTLQAGILTITKAPLTAKADDKTRQYGTANPVFTITYSGFLNSDNATLISAPLATTTASATSFVGTYPITLSGGASTNYALNFQNGTLDITKVSLTAIADNQSRQYGHVNPTLSITYVGFLNGDNSTSITEPAATTTANSFTSIGSVPITLSGGTATNYSLILQSGTLTITTSILTVKPDDKVKIYGQVNPPNSLSYSGFVNGDGISSITEPTVIGPTASVTSSVGSYPITLTGGTAANYLFDFQPGSLTINKAVLTATADNKTKIYGQGNPTPTITYSGFVNGDNATVITISPAASISASPASSVGTYPILISGIGSATNYEFNLISGTLTITKAELSAKAVNQNRTYGANNPPLAISYEGFLNLDGPSSITTPPVASTTANTLSNAGDYPITLSGGSSTNYNFTYLPGTLKINKAILTATADNKSRLFNTTNPPLTISYTGFVNNENSTIIDSSPTAATTAIASSPLGTYSITVSGGNDNNYDFVFVPGTLTVTSNVQPTIKNILVDAKEDTPFAFSYAIFNKGFISTPGDSIVYLKIISVPINGSLFLLGKKVVSGDKVNVKKGVLEELKYLGNPDLNGSDNFSWNIFNGKFSALLDAQVAITIAPVNDPPSLSRIENEPLEFSPGDAPTLVTKKIIINDVDNNFMYSAAATITESRSSVDLLSLDELVSQSLKIVATFDRATSKLMLKGKDSKSNYEKALNNILFSSPVSQDTTLSEKRIAFTVNDSVDVSNSVDRTIHISEILPELDFKNSFTPNNDNANDVWEFNGTLKFYSSINISIFDKNGIKVFDCASKDCAWDGRVGGKELAAGPYMYIINLNEGKRKYQGVVTILR